MTSEEFKKETQRLRSWLSNLARQYLSDDNAAEDIVQETLVRLWQHHNNLHPPIEPWAKTVLRNLAVDELRKRKKTISLNDLQSPQPFRVSPYHSANQQPNQQPYNNAERVDRMMNIINQLPDKQQRILILRHIEGMDMKTLAQATQTNETALRQQLSRARKAVREQYLKKYRKL